MSIRRKENKYESNFIPDETHTYVVDLVNKQNCKLEEKIIGSIPCINFIIIKDFDNFIIFI